MLASIVGNYDLITLFATHGEKLRTQLTYSGNLNHQNTKTRRRKNEKLQRPMGKSSQEGKEPPKGAEKYLCCCCYNARDLIVEDIKDDYQRLHEYQALTSPDMLCYYANNLKQFDPLLKAFQYIEELEYVIP